MSPAALSSVISTQGFHFTLSTTVSVSASQDLDDCALNVLYDLDPHVYADQYELAQRPGYTTSLWGTSDLERPVSAVDPAGSILLLKADTSQHASGRDANITLDVPLHARYGRPADSAYYSIELNQPVGFFACSSRSIAPIPPALQAYTSLPGWSSSSVTLIPDAHPKDRLWVVVPVGQLDDLAWVDVGTALVMIVMFFYLLVASIRTARRLSTKSFSKTD
ncbi:PIG-X [Daedaleopsis nitida]|nr:PIG-X [Daedaleopsis nitida]